MSERQTIYRVTDRTPTLEEIRAQYTPGYIYIIRVTDTKGVYKIGETINVARRILEFQKDHDYRLEIIHYVKVKDKWTIEQALHEKYNRYRLAGEWFTLPDGVINTIRTLISEMDNML